MLRLIALAMPLMTGMIIDRVVPRSDYKLLYVCLVAIGGMTLFNILADVVRSFVLLHLRIALDTRMTLGFLDHMVSLPFSFFQRRSTGDLMMRVDSNGTVREIVTSKSMSAVIDGLFVMLYAVVIFYVNPTLGIITVVMSAAEAAVFLCARPTFTRLLAADLDKQAKAHSYMVQMLGGMETLKCARRRAARPREVVESLHRRAQRQDAARARVVVCRLDPQRGRVARSRC